MVIHNKYIKWREELKQDFCQGLIGFSNEHARIYQVTNVAKYRSFQYRLLQRSLVTNIQLSKWGLADTDRCYFCNEERETISHMMVTCSVVLESFGNKYGTFWRRTIIPRRVQKDAEAILINRIAGRSHVANLICLITKQYIYSQKCLKKQLRIEGLRAKISNIQCIERYIAVKNNKVKYHQKKWCP